MNQHAPLPSPIDRLFDVALGTLIGGLGVLTAVLLREREQAAPLDELSDEDALAEQIYRDWQEDPSTARPYREIRAEMVSEGLLEEEPLEHAA